MGNRHQRYYFLQLKKKLFHSIIEEIFLQNYINAVFEYIAPFQIVAVLAQLNLIRTSAISKLIFDYIAWVKELAA